MRVRLKADGRLVEVTPEGERPLSPDQESARRGLSPNPPLSAASPARDAAATATDSAAYARRVRAATRLTQAEFAARLGVPIDTVRNWEQGKRVPRGPARALLKVIDRAPAAAFAALSGGRGR